MRFILTLTLILIGSSAIFAQSGNNSSGDAVRAQELIRQARAAIGGEEKLKAVQSLSAAGTFRRVIGGQDLSGELEFDLLLPDKYLKSETMIPMPGADITRIEALSGDKAWADARSSGPGRIMIRTAGDGANAQVALQRATQAEFARLLLSWLLTSSPAFPLEFSYAGEAKAEDGAADVLDVKGPNGFAAQLFLDQKTHQPLMLGYRGVAPRMVMNRTTTQGGRSPEEVEKAIKEAQAKAKEGHAEAPAQRPPEVEMQVRFSDYRNIGGLLLPHRISKATNGKLNEEWEMTKFKLNPTLKPEKFEKK